MSELRHRHVNPNPLDSFREFDAFQKLPEEIEQKSTIGKNNT